MIGLMGLMINMINNSFYHNFIYKLDFYFLKIHLIIKIVNLFFTFFIGL